MHRPLSFRTLAPALVVMACGLAGCANPDMSAYPSLARRPIERQVAVVPPQPTSVPTPAVVSATVMEAVAALGRDADAGHSAFLSELAAGRAVVLAGRGAATGSEAWAAAEVALSRMEAARGPTMVALAELDRLTLEQLAAGDAAATAQFAAQQARVAQLAEDQTAALVALTR